MATPSTIVAPRRPWYTILYVQVLLAIAAGILIGHYFPVTGTAFKPLGDGFISLIKMMIGPVIFCTVVHGIGSMRDLKKIGRVGVKTLFYFEAPRRSIFSIMCGSTVSDELVPSTISSSSLMYARKRRMEKPAKRAIVPSTSRTNRMLVR